MHNGIVYTTSSCPVEKNLSALLDAAGLHDRLQMDRVESVLVKPNLVEALDPPITTPVELVVILIRYLQTITDARILIGEGCGAVTYETGHAFDVLGYTEAAAGLGIELVDLNHEELVHLADKSCRRWPEMHIPRIAMESFLISVPVLKAHSLAGVTLTMKNMMGLAPPSHYQAGTSWKKSSFHRHVQEAVADLNRYRTPDFTILDASVGMARAHLWGPTCNPPLEILAAGYDPVAIDAYGSGLLKKNWQNIGHIRTVNGELGTADPLNIIQA